MPHYGVMADEASAMLTWDWVDQQMQAARNIARDDRVVAHLESGDETVIFEGRAMEARVSAEQLKKISTRYLEKYELEPQLKDSGALLLRLAPNRVMAWLERDYPATATYWLFDV